MAEPANTPVPASTPRSASPAPGAGPAGGHHHHHQHHLLPFSLPILSSSSSPASQPQPASNGAKPRVLHLGDPVRYNPGTYLDLASRCDVVRPPAEDRQRPAFLQGLREGRWGDFQAVLRPSWGSGGEMGRWDAELVAALPPSVRVFASAGAGYDWVDTDLLADKGIVYCNGGTAAADAVADFALAMIISTFRHLPWCAAAASSPDPRDFAACHLDAPARSHNLRGKTIGIVGLGSVGRQVAARCAHGFGMRVGFHDVAPVPDDVVSGLGSDVVSHADLASLLAASDCVVLCCPAAPDGRPLITREALAGVRRGARLVNVARGSLVDEDALSDALAEGALSSVALDVFADEARGAGEKLRGWAASGRALLSCHNAGGTVETHAGFEELSIRNVLDVLGGGKGLTPVNLQRLR